MKKNLWIIILAVVIILLGTVSVIFNPDKYIKEVEYKEITKKIKNKDSFILYIKSTDCSHCKEFNPTIKDVASQYKITIYALNLANLSDKDNEKYSKDFSDVEGTPTVLFYKDGARQLITIEGAQPRGKVVSKFKTAGFIK